MQDLMEWQDLIKAVTCWMDGFVQASAVFMVHLANVKITRSQNRWNIQEKFGEGWWNTLRFLGVQPLSMDVSRERRCKPRTKSDAEQR